MWKNTILSVVINKNDFTMPLNMISIVGSSNTCLLSDAATLAIRDLTELNLYCFISTVELIYKLQFVTIL
jgi:hypothetical protein